MTRYYVIENWRDVEAKLHGPYTTSDEQVREARRLALEDEESSFILLDIPDKGEPQVETI